MLQKILMMWRCREEANEAVWSQKVEGNYQRLNILNLPETVKADKVEITVHATNGDSDARIFEVRVY